jgi:hypothetical protein
VQIVPYHDEATAYRRFVTSSFVLGADQPATELRRFLREGARIVVAIGDEVDPVNPRAEDPFYAWAAATHDGRVLWTYTKPLEFEAPDGTVHRNRGRGVAKQLLAALGFTRETPIPVTYDTRAARRWLARGWHIQLPQPQEPAND